jgi:biotin transport system substrate-specific component
MQTELRKEMNPLAAAASRPAEWMCQAGLVLAGSALVALCAHLALPLFFTPVPLTLAPLAVLLLGFTLSPRMAAATLVAYLAEGAAGLPVFAPTPLLISGPARLLGPSGGYLLAYPIAAVLIASLWRRSGKGIVAALTAAAAGNLTILALGALWLAVLTHASAAQALALGVLPFLPGDILKIAAAAALAAGIERRRRAR